MEFRQLEAFVHVYEQQSFSRAAERMFLSQPSISAYIRALEKELGTLLFYRTTKELRATKQGDMLYIQAKNMLQLRENAVLSAKSAGEMGGPVEILASSVPAENILPGLMGGFHRLHPDITFILEQTDSLEVVRGVAAFKAELGFVGAKIESDRCEFIKFMSERLIMIAPNEPRFAQLSGSELMQLLYSGHFVAREVGSGTRMQYEHMLTENGIDLARIKPSAQLGNTQSILHAVAAGLGLSVVSELAARSFVEQGLVLPVAACTPTERDFYMVLKKNLPLSVSAAAFVEHVRNSSPS